ncbi:MAG: hypothetical protein WA624_10645, partial [Methylocella sp.]
MKKALVWFGVLGFVLLAAGGIGWIVYDKLFRKEFPVFASDSDHFKYGSIGNDGVNWHSPDNRECAKRVSLISCRDIGHSSYTGIIFRIARLLRLR